MDFGESLWDERSPLEQVLSMGFCFGLFLLMTTATYLAYFATTYNMVNTKHVFGMEFDVCTKDVCIEQARFLQSTLNRSAEPCGHFYEYACHQWPKTMAATLADNASNVWTLLKRNVFMELDSDWVLSKQFADEDTLAAQIDNPSFGLPEGLLRFEYPEKAGVLDHYHDFIVRVARFFRTDVRLSTVAREIVQFEVNLAKIPWTWIIKDVARNAGISDLEGLEVVLWSKRYLDYLSHLFRQPVIRRHLINYVAWRIILALGPYTSEAFVAIQQDFLRRVGLASNAPRTELCLHDLWTWLPHAAGQLLFARSNQLAPNRVPTSIPFSD
ncbi:hypothetical protein IscW_ISCW005070 [Ixodes scapularis]|uniref:Peptidase M13 N-terminal domain-containing protein n=1 Tax=Ixodes scapularis TaxID=6945 RepID=B7PI33_IXOSC|nr:hypothetical protein IscW_ISCW005070 [Ixodes scapularis]|eukprot:XP_002404218.1 hypothetical protein IscW_ISCW005070 [Ixodes scapularis]